MHEMDDPLRELDLNLLLTLDCLLQERSVSRAARQLGRSQPAISHALARLREQLGDPLLVREGSEMVPTPRAAALGPGLRRCLEDLGRLLQDGGGFDPATARRRFLLVCPDMLAPVVPALLQALSEAPGVDLELRDAPTDEADLVLGALPESAPGQQSRRLGRVSQVVALRKGHPALEEGLTLDAYVRWPHIVVRTGNPGPSIVERRLEAAGLSRRVGLVVPTFLLAAQVVAGTDLLFTAPGELLSRLDLDLELRPPPLPMPVIPVAALWPERLSADPGHRWFREKVIGVLGPLLSPA